jgi:hypothetical protein
MKKGNIYSLVILLVVLLYGCTAKMQTYDLNEEYATSLHIQPIEKTGDENAIEEEEGDRLVGVPARNFYGGDLKRGGIWWASKGVTLEKGEVFIFEFTQIGADSTPLGATNPAIDHPSTPFGATFPPIDLIKEEVVLKISARAEALDSSITGPEPILNLQVDDATGVRADSKRPSNKIDNSKEFKDYYFGLKDIYLQNEPKKKVNGALINSLKFLVSPNSYSGRIYIREIKVVPAPKN